MSGQEVIRLLRKVNIPSDKYIVTMGAVLSVHGLRTAGDVDIIFDKRIQRTLESKGFRYKPISRKKVYRARYVFGDIEAFICFYHVGTYRQCLRKYKKEMIEGIPFMALEDTLRVKKLFGREKDREDFRRVSAGC